VRTHDVPREIGFGIRIQFRVTDRGSACNTTACTGIQARKANLKYGAP
jgi:hypothetical protein